MSVGCDIVQIARIQQAMKNEKFLKILTQEEKVLFEQLPKERQIEWLAGRFAAKEAIIKAIAPFQEMVLSSISVGYENKCPSCQIKGYKVEVSIAHEKEYAIAFAQVEKEDYVDL